VGFAGAAEPAGRHPCRDAGYGEQWPADRASCNAASGRRDYTARLEVLDNGQTFAHLDVHRWTARSAAAMRRDLRCGHRWHSPIYVTQTAHPHNDDFDKWRKFVTMMGFKFRNTAPNGWSVYCAR
jgi:hypothetical protein